MTIKILHLADIHIGMENYGRINAKTGLHTRLEDFLATFDQVVQLAQEEDVDLVVFAGDAFKNRDPNPTQQREFARRIKALARQAPVVLVVGNHDLPNTEGKAHSMEIYGTLEIPNVLVARQPELFRVETKGGPVQVAVLPFAGKSGLLTREQYKNLTLEELNNVLLDRVKKEVVALAVLVDPEVPALLTTHLSVAGAMVGSERVITLGGEMVVPKEYLAREEFAYIALGHIHKYQVLQEVPLMVYSGSMDRIDFGEEADPKGVVLVEIEGVKAIHRFVPLEVRSFVTIRVDADTADPTATILEAIEESHLDGAIVRLVISIPLEKAALIQQREIRRALETKAFFVSGISRELQNRQALLRNPELTEKLDPMEALEKYLVGKTKLKLDRNELLNRARGLATEIKDEEVGMVL
ncbi:MAG: metallophosphoesterase family protein [Thermincolia bacterium]